MKKFLVLSILMIQALVGFAQTDRQHIRYGNRWFKQDNYVKAEAEYRKAVDKNPSNPQALYNLGCALLMQKKDSAAIQQFEHAGKIETDPKELEALFCEESFKEDYKILNREIRNLGYNIPPLVNAYMGLSPTMKLFGTAINDGFGDVEETGILIAVDEILENKRMRHIDTFIKEHPEALQITSGANNVIYKEK